MSTSFLNGVKSILAVPTYFVVGLAAGGVGLVVELKRDFGDGREGGTREVVKLNRNGYSNSGELAPTPFRSNRDLWQCRIKSFGKFASGLVIDAV